MSIQLCSPAWVDLKRGKGGRGWTKVWGRVGRGAKPRVGGVFRGRKRKVSFSGGYANDKKECLDLINRGGRVRGTYIPLGRN